ncbi:hypothetical protein IGI04_024818 [Brassica rapa subsp. trilocularis]|uniref:Uncharacterized protein n=1 Tax=Brassica rapa subsp. trilocularis TaxID=1813537 RepID=A0ABQ7MAB0_BRACM|nr:hypothetical protein IGI04_024818 [Brassica rapa subsp. trilocularis]
MGLSLRPQGWFKKLETKQQQVATKSKKKDGEENNWEMPDGHVPSWTRYYKRIHKELTGEDYVSDYGDDNLSTSDTVA